MRSGDVGKHLFLKFLWQFLIRWQKRYLNFMMLCTGLMEQQQQPLYLLLLNASPSPSVRNLQLWIQSAWDDGKTLYSSPLTKLDIKSGFDDIGRNELQDKIIGTSKWIGTAGATKPLTSLDLGSYDC